MNAIICDRCGAVQPGITEPYAAVALVPGGLTKLETVALQLCSSCEHDVRAFLSKQVNARYACDIHVWLAGKIMGGPNNGKTPCLRCGLAKDEDGHIGPLCNA